MLNADLLLAALQWVLIGVGVAICVGCVLSLMFPGDLGAFVYTYADGRTVEAASTGSPGVASEVTSLLMGFAAGLVTTALGGMLFCLRRIGNFMGDLRSEMRLMRNEEV